MHELEALSPTEAFGSRWSRPIFRRSVKWDPKRLAPSFKIYRSKPRERQAGCGPDRVARSGGGVSIFNPTIAIRPSSPEDAVSRRAAATRARDRRADSVRRAGAGASDDRVIGFYNRAYLVSAKGEVVAHGTTRCSSCRSASMCRFAPCWDFSSIASCTGWAIWFPARSRRCSDRATAQSSSVLICYESIFPDLARRAVKAGAEVMVNITNDAWYGKARRLTSSSRWRRCARSRPRFR